MQWKLIKFAAHYKYGLNDVEKSSVNFCWQKKKTKKKNTKKTNTCRRLICHEMKREMWNCLPVVDDRPNLVDVNNKSECWVVKKKRGRSRQKCWWRTIYWRWKMSLEMITCFSWCLKATVLYGIDFELGFLILKK